MNRTEPTLSDILPASLVPQQPHAAPAAPYPAPPPSFQAEPYPTAQPAQQPAVAYQPPAAAPPVVIAPEPPIAVAPRRASLRLVLHRSIKSGLLSGKKFELSARVDSERDLRGLFKGFSDELLLAFKSGFVDKSYQVRRSELIKGVRFTPGSLNEMIELEERLQMGFDQLRRMIEIIDGNDAEVVIDG